MKKCEVCNDGIGGTTTCCDCNREFTMVTAGELHALRAQLAEAKRAKDSKGWMHPQMAKQLQEQLQSQAAQLAGMREVLEDLLKSIDALPPSSLKGRSRSQLVNFIDTKLSTPASEWEKRVQGLVEALRWYAKASHWEWTTHESTHDGCGCTDLRTHREPLSAPEQVGGRRAAEALAAWEGKS